MVNIQSKNKLHSLIESKALLLDSSTVVVATDENMDVIYVNDIFEERTGTSSDKILGKNFLELLSEFNSVEKVDGWLQKIAEGNIAKLTLKMRLLENAQWIHFSAIPFLEKEDGFKGYLFSGIIKDEEKKLLEILRNNEQEEIFKDLKVAGEYFHALMPSPQKFKRLTHGNGFVFYKPQRLIGGDWYFYTLSNRKLFLLAGDFIGHGIQAGILSTIFITLLRKYSKWEHFYDPLSVVDYFIKKFCNIMQLNNHSNIHLSLISTIYDYDARTVEYVSFNFPIYHYQNQLNRLESYKSDINFVDWNMNNWRFYHLHLNPQEWIWIFSDGAKDQYGDALNKPIGIKKLKDILIEASQFKNVDDSEQFLVSKSIEWIGTSTQTDDITLIGIKF